LEQLEEALDKQAELSTILLQVYALLFDRGACDVQQHQQEKVVMQEVMVDHQEVDLVNLSEWMEEKLAVEEVAFLDWELVQGVLNEQ
jgi:uncharacterized membrane protein YhfC